MKAKVSYGKVIDSIGGHGHAKTRASITSTGKYFLPVWIKHIGAMMNNKLPPRNVTELAEYLSDSGMPDELNVDQEGSVWKFTFGVHSGELAWDTSVMCYFPLDQLAKDKMPWKIKMIYYRFLNYAIWALNIGYNDFSHMIDPYFDFEEDDESYQWANRIKDEMIPDLAWSQIGRHMIQIHDFDDARLDQDIRYLEGRSRYPKRKKLLGLLKRLRNFVRITGGHEIPLIILREDYLSFGDYFNIMESSNDEVLDMTLQGFNDTSECEYIQLEVIYDAETGEYDYSGTDFYRLRYGLYLFKMLIEIYYD